MGGGEGGVERKVKMKAGDLRGRLSRRVGQVVRFGVYASVAAASFLVARAWAGPESAAAAKADAASEEATARVTPNYALEERFLPDQVSKLVFDLPVSPTGFKESRRFRSSNRQTEGNRSYIWHPCE